ncbi:MAG: AMP-binding protein [Anaerovoracaceae bacterium]|nr:AMP-binding protein [Anaerovoracaceae bacterium]
MNSRKYKDVLYQMRYINDLRDMIHSSAELYGDDTSFLVKDVPRGEYRPITYNQLKEDIDCLGTKLTEMGLKDKKVAVIGENSYKWVVSYLAVVNGTGVIVPLDKELTGIEIENLLNRAKVDAIVFSGKMKKKIMDVIEDIDIKIDMDAKEDCEGIRAFDCLLEEGRKLLAEGNRDFIDAVIDREAMCALLFTSGTTGMSKGVMLSHKNISANVYNMSKYVKIRRPGGGLSVLPMHHTYELTCHVFTAIYQGVFVAICEGLKYIQPNLKESRATVMLGVPIVFETMHKKVWKQAEASGAAGKMKKMMALSRKTKLYNRPEIIKKIFEKIHTSLGGNIELFIAGGAAINPDVIKDYETLGIPMIQGYGMTENAPIIAVNRDYYSKHDSVGKPMPGTEVRIIDRDADGIGEIICKGPSVMIGYYDNPEATAEVLKDGWLHTGDYGRFDDEGFLYICGRKKNVIVTKNGKNIFPEEIEQLLMEQPFIEEVLVYGTIDKRDGDVVVKAEVYPSYESIKEALGEITEDGIKDAIKNSIEEVNDKMPAYKRVKRFKLREEEFEKTTTRKIKRMGGAIREEEED